MKTFTGWAANKVSRHGVLKFSHFPLCFNRLPLSNVLICSTLHLQGRSSNFETGTLLKTLKRRAELIANCAFPFSVVSTSSRNGQCLSESRWGSRFWPHLCAALLDPFLTFHRDHPPPPPQTSLPYVSIGAITVSKIFIVSCRSSLKWSFRAVVQSFKSNLLYFPGRPSQYLVIEKR